MPSKQVCRPLRDKVWNYFNVTMHEIDWKVSSGAEEASATSGGLNLQASLKKAAIDSLSSQERLELMRTLQVSLGIRSEPSAERPCCAGCTVDMQASKAAATQVYAEHSEVKEAKWWQSES